MKAHLVEVLLVLAVACGCAAHRYGRAIRAVNKDIELVNREPLVAPITSRVARIEYSAQDGRAVCLDKSGKPLVTLERQNDGRFKGEFTTEAGGFGGEGQYRLIHPFYVDAKDMF